MTASDHFDWLARRIVDGAFELYSPSEATMLGFEPALAELTGDAHHAASVAETRQLGDHTASATPPPWCSGRSPRFPLAVVVVSAVS